MNIKLFVHTSPLSALKADLNLLVNSYVFNNSYGNFIIIKVWNFIWSIHTHIMSENIFFQSLNEMFP